MADAIIDVPTLVFYKSFPDDWQDFADDVREELGKFLELLQRSPLASEILERCETHETYYAYPLSSGYAVYWKPLFAGQVQAIFVRPEKILVLAVEEIVE